MMKFIPTVRLNGNQTDWQFATEFDIEGPI